MRTKYVGHGHMTGWFGANGAGLAFFDAEEYTHKSRTAYRSLLIANELGQNLWLTIRLFCVTPGAFRLFRFAIGLVGPAPGEQTTQACANTVSPIDSWFLSEHLKSGHT